jgi:hypothetical protein
MNRHAIARLDLLSNTLVFVGGNAQMPTFHASDPRSADRFRTVVPALNHRELVSRSLGGNAGFLV